VINLRPDADHPERGNIVVDIGRVRRVLLRVAAESMSSPALAASLSSSAPRLIAMCAPNADGV
jgi:hypothetical protein